MLRRISPVFVLLVATVASAQDLPPEFTGEKKKATGNLEIPASVSGERRQKLEEAIAAWTAADEKLKGEGFAAAEKLLDDASKLLRARVAAEPANPLPRYYLGELYLATTDERKAVENLGAVVKTSPRFHEAWTSLGIAHVRLAEHDKAEAAFSKALEIAPDFMDAWRWRAWARMDAGRFPDARADATRGLELAPLDPFLVHVTRKLQLAIEGPKWTLKFEKETENYIVKTDVDQPFADWVGHRLELIRKVYVKLFEKTKIEMPKRKYIVIVFADAKEYHDFAGPALANAGGHYDPEIRQLFLFRYPKIEDGQMVLFHEGFHQFLHPYLSRAPQWFNEGLGDYFGGAKYVKSPEEGMKIVANWWRLPGIKGAVSGGTAKKLKELLLMSRAQMYDKATAAQNYAQAWSFIYFLCEYNGRKYFPLLGKYFNALRAGKSQEEAFAAAFAADIAKLEEEWKAFVLQLN